MRALKVCFVVLAFVLLSSVQLFADPINVYVGAGTMTMNAVAGGQLVTFSGNRLFTSDSSFGTPLTISPGSGSFLFTSASGAHGFFAPLNGASFSMGDATSGIARGTIDSIQIIGATVGASLTSFTMQLTFSNITFQNCSTSNCVNSLTLMQLAEAGRGDAILHFSFQNSLATNAEQLLALTGTHTSTMSGEFDATVTPEPASLALFGTGLLLFGLRLGRHGKKQSTVD